MPAAHYPVYLVTAQDPSWSAFWQQWTALPFWPIGQLWFLWFLLALDILAVGLWRIDPDAVLLKQLLGGRQPTRYVAELVTVTAAGYIPLAAVFNPWERLQFGPFSFQPSFSLVYVIYFFAGVAIGLGGIEQSLLATDGPLAHGWRTWAAGALIGFMLWIIPTGLSLNTEGATAHLLTIFADLGFAFSSALSCFGVLSFFLRFFATPSPVLETLSRNAYGMYLFHYSFVIWLQYTLLSSPLCAVGKAGIVFTGTLALSWVTTVAVSQLPIGSVILAPGARNGRCRSLGPTRTRASRDRLNDWACRARTRK